MAVKKSELYSSLWSSCDELRGSMDASQYTAEQIASTAPPVDHSQGPASDTAGTDRACCDAAPSGFRSRAAAPYDTAAEPLGKQTPQSVVFGSESS